MNTQHKVITNTISSLSDKIKELMIDTHDNLYANMEAEIRNDMMKKITGNNMYDYSKVEEIEFFKMKNGVKTKVSMIEAIGAKNTNLSKCQEIVDNKNKFMNDLVENEKIVIHDTTQTNNYHNTILITNRAKLLNICRYTYKNHDQLHKFDCEYTDYDFWLPIDYIQLINNLLINNVSFEGSLSIVDRFRKILGDMKKILYDRKFMPLYVLDVMKENEELKKLNASYTNNMSMLTDTWNNSISKLNEEMSHALFEYKECNVVPWNIIIKDVLDQKIKNEEEKKRLLMIAKKLKIDKDEFEKQKREFDNIDINDLFI